jgi:hypothetical protein
MNFPYKITTYEDVYKLNRLASHEDFTIYLSTSSEMFDAKSLLALFTLLGRDVNIIAPDRVDVRKFSKFIEKLTAEKRVFKFK